MRPCTSRRSRRATTHARPLEGRTSVKTVLVRLAIVDRSTMLRPAHGPASSLPAQPTPSRKTRITAFSDMRTRRPTQRPANSEDCVRLDSASSLASPFKGQCRITRLKIILRSHPKSLRVAGILASITPNWIPRPCGYIMYMHSASPDIRYLTFPTLPLRKSAEAKRSHSSSSLETP